MKVNMKEVMTNAVKLAREMEGDWTVRMKIALKIAWNNIKKGAKKVMEFIGSEKQVKWANDVYAKSIEKVEEIIEGMKKYAARTKGTKMTYEQYIKFVNEMKQIKEASFWIDHFGYAKTYTEVANGLNKYVNKKKEDIINNVPIYNRMDRMMMEASQVAMKLYENDILSK